MEIETTKCKAIAVQLKKKINFKKRQLNNVHDHKAPCFYNLLPYLVG